MKHQQASRETFLKAKSGDVAARNEIILKTQGIVVMVAQRVCDKTGGNADTLHDLCQDGLLHVVELIRLYDHERATKFTTFAAASLSRKLMEIRLGDSVIQANTRSSSGEHLLQKRDVALSVVPLRPVHYSAFATKPERTDPLKEDRLAFVRRKVMALPDREREVLTRRMNGEEFPTIASALGIRVAKARDASRRGIRRIQMELAA